MMPSIPARQEQPRVTHVSQAPGILLTVFYFCYCSGSGLVSTVLEMGSRALHTLGKCSALMLHP